MIGKTSVGANLGVIKRATRGLRGKGWMWVAPCVLVILGVSVFPLLYSLRLSFIRWDALVPGQEFVGLVNYADVLGDVRFWESIRTTLIIVFGAVGLEFVVGLALALACLGQFKAKRWVVSVLVLPVTVIPIVVAFTWKLLWDAQYGPINHVVSILLQSDFQFTWLGKTWTAFLAIIVTDVWQWSPFVFLALLAGLSSLSNDIFEAAAIDGASPWETFRRITLPLLSPVIVVVLLIRSLDAFKLFDVVYSMTEGGPGTSTEPVSFYLYRLGFQYFRFGYTAAASYVVLIFLSLGIIYLLSRLSKAEA